MSAIDELKAAAYFVGISAQLIIPLDTAIAIVERLEDALAKTIHYRANDLAERNDTVANLRQQVATLTAELQDLEREAQIIQTNAAEVVFKLELARNTLEPFIKIANKLNPHTEWLNIVEVKTSKSTTECLSVMPRAEWDALAALGEPSKDKS